MFSRCPSNQPAHEGHQQTALFLEACKRSVDTTTQRNFTFSDESETKHLRRRVFAY